MELDKSWIIRSKRDYVVIHKPPGVLCQGTDPDSASLTDIVAQNFDKKLHILNRLDRPVQGLVIFSRTKRFTRNYLKQQSDNNVSKTYWALVEGNIESDGTCEHRLVHDKKRRKAIVTSKEAEGKPAFLKYEVIKRLDNYTALKISLHSGKFHQIRAQLADIGNPIKGDVKYGARRKNKDRSIYLCATGLKFASENGDIIEINTRPLSDTLWDLVQ